MSLKLKGISTQNSENLLQNYTVHLCSGNNGLTTYTTSILLTIVHDKFRLSKKHTINGTRLFSYRLFQINI